MLASTGDGRARPTRGPKTQPRAPPSPLLSGPCERAGRRADAFSHGGAAGARRGALRRRGSAASELVLRSGRHRRSRAASAFEGLRLYFHLAAQPLSGGARPALRWPSCASRCRFGVCFLAARVRRTDSSPQTDLRVADKLYVEVKAPTRQALAQGVARVQHAISDVLQAHGAAPTTPPQPPSPVAEQIVVVPAESSAPPPAWGVAPAAPPAPSLADEALAEQSCGLCMSDVVANVRMMPCDHRVCVTCVASLRRRALFISVAGVPCPYCRVTIVRYDAPPGVDIGLQARVLRVTFASALPTHVSPAARRRTRDVARAARNAAAA